MRKQTNFLNQKLYKFQISKAHKFQLNKIVNILILKSEVKIPEYRMFYIQYGIYIF